MNGWLEVELAATDAWAAEGRIPAEAAAACRERASFTVAAVQERERTTNHDVAAFVDVVSDSIGEHGRWIHYGLTSSDVLDTALGAATGRGRGDPDLGRPRLSRRARCEGARARRDALRRAYPRRPRRADQLRAPAGRLRVRGGPQPDPLARSLRAGCGRQALRRRRHLRLDPAERRGCGHGPARAAGRGDRHPGRPSRPPCRRPAGDRARRRRDRALRPGDPQPPADRGARGRGAVRLRRPEGLVGDAAQAKPDHRRARLRVGARLARLRPGGARERRPLARARHLTLRCRAGDPARRDDPARLHPAPRDAAGHRDDRLLRTGCGPTSSSPTAPCSASGR